METVLGVFAVAVLLLIAFTASRRRSRDLVPGIDFEPRRGEDGD